PLFILAPPRSFSSVICAMLGQHPQMYGLPELHLFTTATMADQWRTGARGPFSMGHGLLRAVAQVCYGAQTEVTIEAARGWLRRRSHFTTGMILEELCERVQPLMVVEKSPTL